MAILITRYNVLDAVKAFEKVSGKEIPYRLCGRRVEDVTKEILGWEAKRTLEQMCEDSWRWQSNNPNGYGF